MRTMAPTTSDRNPLGEFTDTPDRTRGDISFTEFAERALVGVLLGNPNLVVDIAQALDAEDFQSPFVSVVYEHLCYLVEAETGAMPPGEQVWALYADGTDGRTEIVLTQRQEITADQVAAEQIRRAEHLSLVPLTVPSGTPDQSMSAVAREIIDNVAYDDAETTLVSEVTPNAVRESILANEYWRDAGTLGGWLHTLMATAPTVPQPEVYAEFVVEAKIRRSMAEAGIRIGQTVESNPELHRLLKMVTASLDELDSGYQRWTALTGSPASLGAGGLAALDADDQRVPYSSGTGWLDFDGGAPGSAELRQAEEMLIGSLLADHRGIPHVDGKLLPGDISDEQLGNTYRALLEVDHAHAETGQHVDPITVARQQEINRATNGPGAPPARLMQLVNSAFPSTPQLGWAADVVMRGSLARTTARASEAVQEASLNPCAKAGRALADAHAALGEIPATVDRMIHGATRPRTRADLHQLKQHTARLSDGLAAEPQGARPARVVVDAPAAETERPSDLGI